MTLPVTTGGTDKSDIPHIEVLSQNIFPTLSSLCAKPVDNHSVEAYRFHTPSNPEKGLKAVNYKPPLVLSLGLAAMLCLSGFVLVGQNDNQNTQNDNQTNANHSKKKKKSNQNSANENTGNTNNSNNMNR